MKTKTSITEEDMERLVREFYIDVIRSCENDCDDTIYEELSEDLLDKYDFEEIVKLLNFESIVDVVKLGVKQKYGIDLYLDD